MPLRSWLPVVLIGLFVLPSAVRSDPPSRLLWLDTEELMQVEETAGADRGAREVSREAFFSVDHGGHRPARLHRPLRPRPRLALPERADNATPGKPLALDPIERTVDPRFPFSLRLRIHRFNE